ncbi:MAG: HEAT repeat domain-containing protein [Elusimicrobia bacterium]|nr:HEAT repeat domain-containing protein [Elusimicrobiota bacterium]
MASTAARLATLLLCAGFIAAEAPTEWHRYKRPKNPKRKAAASPAAAATAAQAGGLKPSPASLTVPPAPKKGTLDERDLPPGRTACDNVNRIFLRIDRLVLESDKRDVRTVSSLDKRIQEYRHPVAAQGKAAVPCLAAVAMDPDKPLKSRLWALSFAAAIKDYSVFMPLKAVLNDAGAPGELRSTAASYMLLMKGVCQAASEQGGPPQCIGQEEVRREFCASLEDKALPPPALREVLAHASVYGCDDAGPLEHWIKSFGVAPTEHDWQNANFAILALARARSPVSTRVLLRLFKHYPVGSRGRKLVYKALLLKDKDLSAMKETVSPQLAWELEAEPGPVGQTMVLQLLAMVNDPASAGVFVKFLGKEDPGVVGEAASGLAAIGAKQAIPELEKLLAGVEKDSRFAGTKGRPRPREAIDRIRDALDALWAR